MSGRDIPRNSWGDPIERPPQESASAAGGDKSWGDIRTSNQNRGGPIANDQRGGPRPARADTFTVSELEALKAADVSFRRYFVIGNMIGGSFGFWLRSRRPPKPASLWSLAAWSFGGALLSGAFVAPMGLFSARKQIQNVENPRHFAEVLEGVYESKKLGGPSLQKVLQQQQAGGPAGAHGINNMATTSGSPDWRDQSYGSAAGATEVRPAPQAPSPQSYTPSSDPFAPAASASSSTQPTGSGKSRWAEIRGEPADRGSAWDRLRQQQPSEQPQQQQQLRQQRRDVGLSEQQQQLQQTGPGEGEYQQRANEDLEARRFQASYIREGQGGGAPRRNGNEVIYG
ncbi:unnamed protein product [Parajaminaea phylloscopi]